jgi:50S ribosomal subunit-associated GTPase HflX
MVTVFNKIDTKQIENSNLGGKCYVSALTGEGVKELKSSLTNFF